MRKILSTRTLKEYLIDYGRQLNLAITCVDFIETISVAPDLTYRAPADIDAAIFTSANAVKYFFENYAAHEIIKDKRIFSLAGATSDELLQNGITPAHTAGSAITLSQLMVDMGNVKSALHICGDKRLSTIEDKLSQNKIQYHQLVVYETILITNKKIEEEFDAIMFYSPSGVKSFFANNVLKEEQVFCCIGDTTANALRELRPDLNILIPEDISLESMIDMISEYYKKQTPV
jgi:uroporphyrinogen-III synthase